MLRRPAALALIGSLAATVPGVAADFTRVVEQNRIMVALSGEIVLGDELMLRDALSKWGGISAIKLDSPGGSLVASIRLAKLIRSQGLNTIVGPRDACASACFLIFASGRKKFIDRDSFIGVHGVADKGGAETPDSKAATLAFARYIQDLGSPPSVVYKLVSTPPNAIVQLSLADLHRMGATITGSPQHTRHARQP